MQYQIAVDAWNCKSKENKVTFEHKKRISQLTNIHMYIHSISAMQDALRTGNSKLILKLITEKTYSITSKISCSI